MNLKRFYSTTTLQLIITLFCSMYAENVCSQQQLLWKFPTSAAIFMH